MTIAADDNAFSPGGRTMAGGGAEAVPLVTEPPPTRYPEPELAPVRPVLRLLAWGAAAVIPWLLLAWVWLDLAGQGR
ncbi:MAG TPA: hypothetical protein VED40_15125 [Azospirillaceae bacterium]|nr:hypothetical protein [Azospirillaceae bacterium]